MQFVYFRLIPLPFQPPCDGFLLEIVDNEWRKDTLPFEKIFVPDDKLPDAEADNGDVQLTLNEMVRL